LNSIAIVIILSTTLVACNPLKPAADQPITFYGLNSLELSSLTTNPRVGTTSALNLPTLIVNPPHAAAGFDTSKIIYLRKKFQIDYYAQSEWIAPPPRMLAPLIVERLSRTGKFKAVVLTPTAVVADLRLTAEIVRLQHEFFDETAASRVRFTLRVQIMDEKTRRVLEYRELDAVVAATTENAAGGVSAANSAAQVVLDNLAVLMEAVLSAR
jgi:cholesterol transport system auxiliary component